MLIKKAVIHKFGPLGESEQTQLGLPRYAKVLHVNQQKGRIFVWAEVTQHSLDKEPEYEKRTFEVRATGEKFDVSNRHIYLTTVHVNEPGLPPLVWHVYEYNTEPMGPM